MAAVNPVGTKRLAKEHKTLQKDTDPFFRAVATENDVRLWYFIIKGAEGTVYDGGYYMGKLVFPGKYPFKAPAVQMITPSGRFKTGMDLCLSISNYHPESWNPSWGARSVILGLHSFMSDEADPTTAGGITAKQSGYTEEQLNTERIRLRKASKAFNESHTVYKEYFKGFQDESKEEEEKKGQKRVKLS